RQAPGSPPARLPAHRPLASPTLTRDADPAVRALRRLPPRVPAAGAAARPPSLPGRHSVPRRLRSRPSYGLGNSVLPLRLVLRDLLCSAIPIHAAAFCPPSTWRPRPFLPSPEFRPPG